MNRQSRTKNGQSKYKDSAQQHYTFDDIAVVCHCSDLTALCVSLLASCGVCSGAFGVSTANFLPGIFTLQSNLLPFKQVVIIQSVSLIYN